MDNVKFIFKSLVKNQEVLDHRKMPWYFALLFFVLGIFLPWIPNLYKGYTTDSSAFISQQANFEIDKGLSMMAQSVAADTIEIQKDGEVYTLDMSPLENPAFEENNVNMSNASYDEEYNGTSDKSLAKACFNDGASVSSDFAGQVFTPNKYVEASGYSGEAHVFYFDALKTDAELINPAPFTSSSSSGTSVTYEDNGNTYFLLAYYIPTLDTTTEKGRRFLSDFVASVILDIKEDGTAIQNYPHSYIIFSEDSVHLVTYPIRSALTNSYGTEYSGVFNDAVASVAPTDGTTLHAFFYRDSATNEQALTNIKTFFNAGQRESVINQTWFNCGILSAVYAGLVLVASGILIFLQKRKRSVYKDATYWQALKESLCLALMPAILGTALGFLSFEYGIAFLILGVLFRVIWMNSKIAPVKPSDNKPLYQARS